MKLSIGAHIPILGMSSSDLWTTDIRIENIVHAYLFISSHFTQVVAYEFSTPSSVDDPVACLVDGAYA